MGAPWRAMVSSGIIALILHYAGSSAPGRAAEASPAALDAVTMPESGDLASPDELAPRQATPDDGLTAVPEQVPSTPTELQPPAAKEMPAVTAEPPLPAINAAIRAVLEARADLPSGASLSHKAEREAIASFYALRNFAPLWFPDGKLSPETTLVIERLEHASDDGLDVKGFPAAVAPATAQETASADIALSDAVVSYGRQASGSRIDPRMISRLIGVEPEVADPAVILALVSTASTDAGDQLRRFNPPQKAYLALRHKLIELRRGRGIIGHAGTIPPGPVLRIGMRDPRVPLLRERLTLDGEQDMGATNPSREGNSVYDETVAAAVAEFQKANGLPPSGKLTARTAQALSGGGAPRLEAEILANMERWRWMPRDMGERHIEVNIPDYEAAIIDKGEVIERVRVVTGKEETPTPLFSGTMRYLIVNPSWHVPQSIIRKEMLPHLASDPGYFQRMGYEVFSHGGHLEVRQPPGERNALGRIKFVFPNDFAVYMHDTPLRKLFAQSKRAFSHGCVRVDDPFRFAEMVLGPANGWSEERVKRMIGGRERYVYLPKPLPVHLEYFTAFVDETGELQLREDVYGYSRRVQEALGLEGHKS